MSDKDSRKGGAKKGAAKGASKVAHIGQTRASKGGAKKGAAGDDGGFTAGSTNPNIKPDPAGKASSKRATQPDLIPDRRVEPLHSLALDYRGIVDERVTLSNRETEAKKKLLDEMHRLERDQYTFDGVTVRIVHEKEKVVVKVNASDEEKTHVELL